MKDALHALFLILAFDAEALGAPAVAPRGDMLLPPLRSGSPLCPKCSCRRQSQVRGVLDGDLSSRL